MRTRVRTTPSAAHRSRVACSIFVLKSCEGFRQAQFNLWCCNRVQCNREYTSDFLFEIGAIQEPLERLTCVEVGALSYTPAQPGAAPSRRRIGSGGTRFAGRGDTGVMDHGGMLMRTPRSSRRRRRL